MLQGFLQHLGGVFVVAQLASSWPQGVTQQSTLSLGSKVKDVLPQKFGEQNHRKVATDQETGCLKPLKNTSQMCNHPKEGLENKN